MTEEEKDAMEILNINKLRIYKNAFSQFRDIRRADANTLKMSGHATKEAAIFYIVEHYLKEIAKLEEAHLARFPD